MLPYLIGFGLAVAVAIFARVVGLDRDRAFYPTVLIVIASTYGLFATIGGSTHALVLELLPMAVFVALAVLGFKGSAWLVVAGLVGHGIFDAFHGHLIANPGVPAWWPAFCATYDVVAGAVLAWLVWRAPAR